MFESTTTLPQVVLRSQDIFLRLRTALGDAADFYAWLSAQSDDDLGTDGLGFTAQDLQFLRGAYADVMALRQFTLGQLPPGTYPQPTGAYPYFANVTQIIGPA